MNTDEQFRAIIAGKPETTDRAKLAAIVKAYDMTRDNPNTRIPTLLMATIEMART